MSLFYNVYFAPIWFSATLTTLILKVSLVLRSGDPWISLRIPTYRPNMDQHSAPLHAEPMPYQQLGL